MKISRSAFAVVLIILSAVAARATIEVNLQMQLGNPSNAATATSNHDHYLIQRAQYALDYSDRNGEPNWVSWDLTADDVGSSGRSTFIPDTTLPTGFYQVQPTDYTGSGYDRGHMCPSADRTVTTADNQILFYMSNILPQAPDNNEGVWANFESYCRSLASAGNELLIICGPSGFGGSRIPSGVAAIPGYVWKVVVVVPLGGGTAVSRIDTMTRVIAIKIPNIAGVRSDPWENYVTSAAQIEADTGYTFFTALQSVIADALRVKVDGQSSAGAPIITTQPSAQTTTVGGSASFLVTATGDAPLAYQWLNDVGEIPGATDAMLNLANLQAGDAGNYYVVVTNNVGSATSDAAALIISGLPPTITTPPAGQTAAAGSNVTFSISAGGSAPLVYQWRKDGANIGGATNAALTLINAQAGSAGSYDVVVTNSVGLATSAAANLTVTPAAPTITTPPAARTVTGGTNVTFSVVATGTAPLSYQWRKGGTALPNGGVVSGATTAVLTLTGVGNGDAGSYDVVVTNSVGSATSSAALLTVNAATVYWDFATAGPTSGLPVDITGGTVTQNNNNGSTPMLNPSSASTGYAGASGGNNAGAAARIGILNKGTGGSAYFEFTLTPAAGEKLRATAINFGSRSTSTGPQAFGIFTSFDNFAAPVASGTLFNNSGWVLKSPAFAAVTGTTGAAVTFRIYGYSGTGNAAAGTANWRIDDLALTVNTITGSAPVAPAVTGTTPADGATGIAVSSPITVTFNEPVIVSNAWFAINSAAHGPVAATVTGGPITFMLTPPVSFAYSDTVSVTIAASQVIDKDTSTLNLPSNYTFAFSTGLPVPPSITTQPVAQSVADGTNAAVTVAASGTAPLSYQWRKNGIAITGNGSAATATLALTPVALADAGNYDCVVSNVAGSVTSNAVLLTVNPAAPAITTPPGAKLVTVGSNATFTAIASGTAPLVYQWRRNGAPLTDGGVVSGATTPTLTLTGVTAADVGSYDVVVTNAAGSVSSGVAALNVTAASLSTVGWDFSTASPTGGLPADVSGGTVTQNNNNGSTTMLTSASVSSGYTGASGGNNAGAAARIGVLNQGANGSAYFEFTFTPAAGEQLVATAISFGSRSTSTGPQAFSVYTSVDNFTAPLAAGKLSNDTVWRLITPAIAGVRGAPGTAVTFRIYGYNGSGSPGAGTANWRIDDLKITIGTETVPVVGATSPAAGATGVAISSPITITFNQAVTTTGAWFSLVSAATGNLAATATGGPTTFTLTPAANFGYSDTVTVTIFANQVTDQTGVLTLPSNDTFSFATISPVPPTVTVQPQPQVAMVGDSATFTVTASGTAPLLYQWRKNGVGIAGNSSATTASLTLTNVTTADAGSFDCVVTNIAGNVTSTPAALTVNKAVATVTLGHLSATYDGTPKPATATTNPAGLTANVTYDDSSTAPTNAGSYSVAATIIDANYTGSASGTLTIAKAAVPVSLGGLNATYDGFPHAASAATTPPGLGITVAYNGSAAAPVNAGSYAVVANVNDSNYTGTASGTLTISPAAASVALDNLNQTYDGTPKAVAVTTTPAGLTVNLTYDGSATPPTNAGSYAVAATVVDANYTGSAHGTLTVAKADQTISFNPVPGVTYGDTPFTVNATASSGLAVTFSIVSGPATISGNTVTISGAGPVVVRASQAGDANHNPAPDVDQAFTVGKANQATAFNPIPGATFGDTPFAISATAGSGLPVSFAIVSGAATINGNTVTITGAGAVVVRASQAGDANYNPAPDVDQQFTVGKANQVITFAALADKTYGDAPFTVTATASSGLPVSFSVANGPASVSGHTVTLTGAGGVILRASQVGDANYNPAPNVDQTFAVAKAALTATAQSATRVYGTANPALTIAYGGFVNGDTAAVLDTPPTAATTATAASDVGAYPITVGGGADDNYTFIYVNGTLTITPAGQVISFGPLANRTFGDAPFSVSATASSNLPVSFSVVSGPAAVSGNTVTLTGAGTVVLRASQGGSLNYAAAAPVDQSFSVAPAAAAVTLGNLNQVYSGTPKTATVATNPAGLAVQVTYNGSSTPPMNAGSYAVLATVADANYTGSAAGTLTIRPAGATIVLGNLSQIYDGTPKSVTVTTSPAGLAVHLTYDDDALPPVYPGAYAVVATVTDPNHVGSASGMLVISVTALVRHAPTLNGSIDGSIQVLSGENITLNSNMYISGDLLVPGTPTVRLNGHPALGGTLDGIGSPSPSGYVITLNGNAIIHRLVRHTDPITLPAVHAPPPPAGTRDVTLNSAGQSAGNFATVRNLTLNGNVGQIAVPAGTYGSFIANSNSGFVLGVPGATQPAVYNLQSLTLNGNSQLQVVGPVILTLANGVTINDTVGSAAHPGWLTLNVYSGGVTLNSNVTFNGWVIAPAGTVIINGNSTLNGGVISDSLTINGNGLLNEQGP